MNPARMAGGCHAIRSRCTESLGLGDSGSIVITERLSGVPFQQRPTAVGSSGGYPSGPGIQVTRAVATDGEPHTNAGKE